MVYKIEKEIIERSVSSTEEPDKNNDMFKFMLNQWNQALLNDELVWKTPYSHEQIENILK